MGEFFGDGFELLGLPVARAHDANETVMSFENGIFTGAIGVIERFLDGDVFLELFFPDGFAGVGDVGVVGVFNKEHDAVVFGEVLRSAFGGLFAGVVDGAGDVGDRFEPVRPFGAGTIKAVAENKDGKEDDADGGEAVFALGGSRWRCGSGRIGLRRRTSRRRSGRRGDG